jgi:eukaryotic-like serine/threonine-protein kinase
VAAVAQLPEIPDLRIGNVIGRGTHSVVYRATHKGRSYALKVLEPDASTGAQDRLLEARRLAARLARARHPALPRILTVGQAGLVAYVVMELVEGETLRAAIEAGPLAEAAIV